MYSQDSQYLPVISHSDVQSDMARHDEEGSGGFRDENDDEEYGGSGDGSGEGNLSSIIHVFVFNLFNQFFQFSGAIDRHTPKSNPIDEVNVRPTGGATSNHLSMSITLTLFATISISLML